MPNDTNINGSSLGGQLVNDVEINGSSLGGQLVNDVEDTNYKSALDKYASDYNMSGGYPKGLVVYGQTPEETLTPKHHFRSDQGGVKYEENQTRNTGNDSFLVNNHSHHFTRDVNDINLKDMPVSHNRVDGSQYAVFSGSTTNINPLNDPYKSRIIQEGLSNVDATDVMSSSGNNNRVPPISPIHPFTRIEPRIAQTANLTTYNRTKLPIADLEHRKGFRHIFFTRPECYIMARNPNGTGSVLSEQCEYDEDFSSAVSRIPHILKLLSPIYITGSFSQNNINSNWNYLLSNRVLGLTTASTTLTVNENVTKSIEGFTVTTPMHMESRQGASIDLRFRDTKNLEISEMLRLWMLYMYKRKKGVFAPPYNGYQYRNGFIPNIPDGGQPVYTTTNPNVSDSGIIYHPYDRAQEYCCSIFDIVTNESMTKILYWCKYYGAYPISLTTDGLSNDNNTPLTNDMTVSATFKYHYKLENVNKTLVEFNYNAGITDDLGRVNKSVEASLPFLLHDAPNDPVMQHYIGAAGMFTGSPYIILGQSQNDPLDNNGGIITPYLQFMPLNIGELNSKLNLEITNTRKENGGIIGILRDGGEATDVISASTVVMGTSMVIGNST